MTTDQFFTEFPEVGRGEWLAQVSKDLKGKALEDLDWPLTGGLRVSPLVHAESTHTYAPLLTQTCNWEICELIPVANPAEANALSLEALNGGAEALQFELGHSPSWTEFDQLFAGIHPDFIGLHFTGIGVRQNPAAVLSHLSRLGNTRNLSVASWQGSLEYHPLGEQIALIDWRYLVDLIDFTQSEFPAFTVISIPFSTDEDPVAALSETLVLANEYFKNIDSRGASVSKLALRFQIEVSIGSNYFLEMAKIRAVKLLWLHLLKAWGVTASLPKIAAKFSPQTYTEELYSNMIRASTMAMSAVLGGADRLTVLPYDSDRSDLASYPAAFGRRIARNVQHLLKMESHLDESLDPVAGSLYLENLTNQLAQNAWQKFQEQA